MLNGDSSKGPEDLEEKDPHMWEGKEHLQNLVEEVSLDDGIDPRVFFDRRTRKSVDRKMQRLCGEARDILEAALSMGMREEPLQGLTVIAVDPVPGCFRLRVSVGVPPRVPEISIEVIHGRLVAATAFLRSEIARCLNRRKTPELEFVVRPLEL